MISVIRCWKEICPIMRRRMLEAIRLNKKATSKVAERKLLCLSLFSLLPAGLPKKISQRSFSRWRHHHPAHLISR
jgi:hypothetical protein